MTLTSEDVNIIVLKYLQESGFRHSSFAFQYESKIAESQHNDAHIQPGMLINVIHKGLQFMDIEAHMNNDGELLECSVPFSLLEPHHCELTGKTLAASPRLLESSTSSSTKRQRKEAKKQKEREKRAKRENEDIKTEDVEMSDANDNKQPESIQPKVLDVDPADVTILKGHQGEVHCCAWNPRETSLLASGSADETTNLWDQQTIVLKQGSMNAVPIVLKDSTAHTDDNPNEVTALDWNPDGTLLAAGYMHGDIRIWSRTGQLRFSMSSHERAVLTLKWNMSGGLLLSGSGDKTTIVWDTATGETKQRFKFHNGEVFAGDWMDDTTFASCSNDEIVYLCRLGESEPLRQWVGHEDAVNCARWDPSHSYLASCSDDKATIVWEPSSSKPLQKMKGHSGQVYDLQWAPTIENDTRILATTGVDMTVRLWDALSGTCLHVLRNHTMEIFCLSFSPDSRLLASGSYDNTLRVWNAKEGVENKVYKADGAIVDVHFNKSGDKLAAAISSKQVVVLNIR